MSAQVASDRNRPSDHPPSGRPIAGYPGYSSRYRLGYGYGVGAAAVGAAAAYGAYGYYNNNNCFYDSYGQWVCPNSYGYRY